MTPRAPLERHIHRQGQTLLGRDFQDQLQADDQVRWWHNRAMHEAYGVAWREKPPALSPGGDRVVVPPFLAYDCFGREVLSCETVEIPPPKPCEPPQPMWLMAAAEEPSKRRLDDGPRAFSCRVSTPGPSFHWTPEACWSVRDGVPVARLKPAGASFALQSDNLLPFVQPMRRPRIGSGVTPFGRTLWKPTDVQWSAMNFNPIFGRTARVVAVAIDTSAFGFTRTPLYQAWLIGPRVDRAEPAAIRVGDGWIDSETSDSFTFSIPIFVEPQLMVYAGVNPDPVLRRFAEFDRKCKLAVLWVGVEPLQSEVSNWRPCGCEAGGP